MLSNLKNLLKKFRFAQKTISNNLTQKLLPVTYRLPVKFDITSNILHSPYTDVTLSELNYFEHIWRNVDRWKEKRAFTDAVTGRTYTYDEARSMSERLSISMPDKAGLKPGDTIGLVLPNSAEFAVALLGASSVGLAVSPANPLYTAEELACQMTDAGAKAVVTVPELLPKVKEAIERVPGGGQVIVSTDGSAAYEASLKAAHPELLSLHELMAREYTRHAPRLPRADPDALAVLPYSSGTTGLPKGVRLTHRNLVANLCQLEHPDLYVENRLGNQHTNIGILPFFHIYGMNGVLSVDLSYGHHTVTLPKFDPALFIATYKRYKPSLLDVVPPLLTLLVHDDAISKEDLSSLDAVANGAAAVSPALVKLFLKRVSSDTVEFRQGYSMTELSSVALVSPLRRYGLGIVCAGVPIPNTAIKIVDEEGNAVCQGKEGELLVKGPQVMQGYHNNEQATRETITEDGWLKTGDVAYVNCDGLVFIVDRMKELIDVKGLQVSPTELEAVVRKMEGVADVAVLGVPDERAGESPLAFVVKTPNSAVTENQVMSYVAARVAPHKKVSQVRFVDAIPKSAAGKILRIALKKMLNE